MKMYTAQEMRVRADYLDGALADAKTAAMLRQAADMMERERKYEYAEKFKEGIVSCLHREKPMDCCDMYSGSVNVRRSVGE